MPINKNAYLRLRTIDTLLSNGRTYSKNAILQKIEEELGLAVSSFTFDKDLQLLRNSLRAPIEYDAALKGYYYTDKDFKLFRKEMNHDETSALEFASEALNTLNNVELVQEAQSVLTGMYGKIHKQERRPGKQIIFRPVSAPVKGVEWLNEIYKAIEEERAITIKYYKIRTDEIKSHTLSPYILRQYNDLWYVIAWCADRELTLVFALDRIREMKPAHVSWHMDPGFDPEQYFKYSFGITHSHDRAPEKVVFQIKKEAFYYLQVKPMHPSQRVLKETKKGCLVEIEVLISDELVMYLLGMGDTISVREPVSLRKMMQTRAIYTHNTANII